MGGEPHLEKYGGARTVRIVYFGPVHARGGGVYGVRVARKLMSFQQLIWA